jgi:hypothetical protein
MKSAPLRSQNGVEFPASWPFSPRRRFRGRKRRTELKLRIARVYIVSTHKEVEKP